MHFTKMEGLGNDYVYVNCFEEHVEEPEKLARLLSNRHYGIGGDGLILIGSSSIADFSMSVYNSDGSIAEMCGNGIRCVGKYVYDNHMTDKRNISIETLAGIRRLLYVSGNDRESVISVDMGIPMIGRTCGAEEETHTNDTLTERIEVSGQKISFVRVSMGNPHAVVFLPALSRHKKHGEIMKLGALMERHPTFPNGTNVEFVRVISQNVIHVQVWERGSGETMACGTGACAAAAASIAEGYTEDRVTVRLGGGELYIEYDRNKKTINMTGPARKVFDGYVDIFSQEE